MAGVSDIKREAGGAAKGVSEETITAVFDAVAELAKKGEKVQIKGFGTFEQKFVPAHDSVNPQDPTGPKLKIEDKYKMTFKASKTLDMAPPKPAAPAGRRGGRR